MAGDAFERRRRRMVRELLLRRGIEDARVLEAFLAVPRHLFVDEALAGRAYGDGSLPLGCGQTLSHPTIIARMVTLAAPGPGDAVLEIGTGSGYEAAVLTRLAARVATVEKLEPLARRAQRNWRRAGIEGIRLRIGDGTLGWPEEAPFQAIIVAAAVPAIPGTLVDQLAPGGRLVVPVGSAIEQVLKRVERAPGGTRVGEHDRCAFVRCIGREAFAE